MNISKLTVGQTFKNYKELCIELEMEIKVGTNCKKAQFKELERYCEFTKSGHKITITNVFATPTAKVDKRGENNNIYGNLIQLLITDLLAQCDGQISISKGKLMLTMGMVNCNYSDCRELVQKLAKYTEIDDKVIYDFYNTSGSSFKSVIETALKSLMDKRVIMYNKIIKVSEKDNRSPRTATNLELNLIMEIEKEVLKELGYKQISAVRISRDWKKFRMITKEKIQEESNIDFYFTAYDITINEKYIVEERNELVDMLLEQAKRKESINELNKLVYTNLLINAQKRHEKAFTAGKMAKTRASHSYIENFERLSNLLIDKNCTSILHNVRSIKLEQTELPNELIDDLESLFG